MDDPDDKETTLLVEETRQKAVEIFGDGCSEESLTKLLNDILAGVYNKESASNATIFIPVSARNAFFYRSLSHLTTDNFSGLDAELVDKIGRQELGRKWKKISMEEKCKVISDAVRDPKEYSERLRSTNFDNFLIIFAHLVGDKEVQDHLLSRQVDIALELLNSESEQSISDILHSVYKVCPAIGRPTGDLCRVFWKVYTELETKAITSVETEVNPKALERPFVELENYYKLAMLLGWSLEMEMALARMKQLMSNYLALILEREDDWTFEQFCSAIDCSFESREVRCNPTNGYTSCTPDGFSSRTRCCNMEFDYPIPGLKMKATIQTTCGWSLVVPKSWNTWSAPTKTTWSNLSPHDWMTLLSSVLLPTSHGLFFKHFGVEKTKIEERLLAMRVRYGRAIGRILPRKYVRNLSQEEKAEILELMYADALSNSQRDDIVFKLVMSPDLSDASHWGFPIWKYVSFRESIQLNRQSI
jgi:hypothetical protein